MTDNTKTLKELKNEAKSLGYGVRKWAAMAGLPWQSVYRKIENERSLRHSEYQRLVAAIEQMKGGTGGTERQKA